MLGPLQRPDDIAARGFTPEEDAHLAPMRRRAFVGTGPEVADRIRSLAAELELDEIVVNTWAHDPAVRRHSYALLAREFAMA